MDNISEEFLTEIMGESVNLWEMANAFPDDTGLPMVIWFSTKLGVKHGPRIKVCTVHGNKVISEKLATMTVSMNPELIHGHLTPKDSQKVSRFIVLNYDLIMQFWNMDISTKKFLNELKKV